jgi:hypothetical protein
MKDSIFAALMGAVSILLGTITLFLDQIVWRAFLTAFLFFSWSMLVMLLKKQEPELPQVKSIDPSLLKELDELTK